MIENRISGYLYDDFLAKVMKKNLWPFKVWLGLEAVVSLRSNAFKKETRLELQLRITAVVDSPKNTSNRFE